MRVVIAAEPTWGPAANALPGAHCRHDDRKEGATGRDARADAARAPAHRPAARDGGRRGVYRGRAGNVDVIATLTTMGMTQGEQATERMLEHRRRLGDRRGHRRRVDRSITIGDVIVPEVVLDRRTGKTYRPTPIGDIAPRDLQHRRRPRHRSRHARGVGHRRCRRGRDGERRRWCGLRTRGCSVVGVPRHQRHGGRRPRRPGHVRDDEPRRHRGSTTVIARYLEEHPEKIPVLTQLAHDTNLATEAVAAAAIRACLTF